MARPLLADPHFVRKAEEGRSSEINTWRVTFVAVYYLCYCYYYF